ncbi:MAG: hypothetical protein RLZZ175_671 [Bacteroidota bacterium]|jgi:phosphate transport system substrate-binding protein
MKIKLIKLAIILITCISTFACVYEYKEKKHSTTKNDEKNKTIIINGSTTVHPLMDLICKKFIEKNNTISVQLTSSGSAEGLKSLTKDSTDIAMASNKITTDQKVEFRKKNKEYVEYLLAGDALVFIVNVNNPVKKLTENELLQIYNGKINNWKQIGGLDLPIKIVSRNQKSGTFSFFKEIFLKNNTLISNIQFYENNEDILKSVANDKSVIGFTNFSTLDYSVDPINISFDNSKTNYIAPRSETVNNMTYKYYRGLYLYYNPEKYQKIKPLFELLHSDSMQELITKSGYIKVNQNLILK